MQNQNNPQRFLLATLVPAASGLAVVGLAVLYFQQYGFMMFVALPTYIGFLSAALHGKDKISRILLTTFLALLLLGLALMLFALEGAVCLVMAFPLALGLAFCGSLLGMLTWKIKKQSVRFIPLLLLLFTPFLMSFEASNKSAPTLHKVVSTVEINAPIETVWQTVVAFPQIETEPEGILRLGFAYPVNAKIEGHGVGAVRYCNFNTGAFVEPVTAWQEPNLLAFDVKQQPAPMTETSFYQNLHTPHLDYIKSERGQFRLYEKDGMTVVEGTTFYTHDIAPDFYWNLYSEEIIHQIHLRVLNHIKKVAEK
jgi:hypothetical protein